MHRRPLLALLEAHQRRTELADGERRSLERLIAFVGREPRCFERTCLEGHVTGSAWILDRARQRVLLTHHKKLDLWLQPGGHCDGDPDVLRVALREAEEESGIAGLEPLSRAIFDVDVHAIPARQAEAAHSHFDVRFALIAPDGACFVVSEESHALAWVARDELERYSTDDSVRRMATKWIPA
ncbi:MAG: NUDIX hydrolase [Deltaproteobacteria bacterium]|nr:NUDIX hydrolase [Deltaproteobacteria bacterium]